MGIQGLHKFLKPCLRDTHIHEYSGKTLAVDAYVWLHRGAFSCAEELCTGVKTSKYLSYCIKMLELLLRFNIRPIIIFDGARLPMKENEEKKRKNSRRDDLEKGMSLLNIDPEAAKKHFQKAVDVKPYMAKEFIEYLKTIHIEFIVAPYEADAQLGYLARIGYVDGVITEDSDMIPYGVSLVLFKFKDNGSVSEFKKSNLSNHEKFNFRRFEQDHIILMCLLSGCDYVSNLHGIGVTHAYRLVNQYRNIATIFHHLKIGNKNQVTSEYEERFRKAFLTFKHQRVFDPLTNSLVHFSELPNELINDDIEFLGPKLEPQLAIAIAKGDIDPMSKLPYHMIEENISSTKVLSPQVINNQQKLTHYFKKVTTSNKTFTSPLNPNSPLEFNPNNNSSDNSNDKSCANESSTSQRNGITIENTSQNTILSVDSNESSKHISLIPNRRRNERLTIPMQRISSRSIFSKRVVNSLNSSRDSISSESGDDKFSPMKKKLNTLHENHKILHTKNNHHTSLNMNCQMNSNREAKKTFETAPKRKAETEMESDISKPIKRLKTSRFFKQDESSLNILNLPLVTKEYIEKLEEINASEIEEKFEDVESIKIHSHEIPIYSDIPSQLTKHSLYMNKALELIDSSKKLHTISPYKEELREYLQETQINDTIYSSNNFQIQRLKTVDTNVQYSSNNDFSLKETTEENDKKDKDHFSFSVSSKSTILGKPYLANLNESSNHSNGNLFMHFLEKCKKKKSLSNNYKEIGGVDNPIIL